MASHQAVVLVDNTFGEQFDATANGKAIIVVALKEANQNRTKLTAVPTNVSDFVIGHDSKPRTEQVWVECRSRFGSTESERRACFAEADGRTPQIGDEIAVTGFGGTMWWSGKIFGMRAPKRKLKKPKYFVDVFYTGDKTKTEGLELSETTYGPAQCKIESRRVGETVHERNYTKGWVFLVPRGGEGTASVDSTDSGESEASSAAAPAAAAAAVVTGMPLESADTE